jgi:signal transduction histidine kinase
MRSSLIKESRQRRKLTAVFDASAPANGARLSSSNGSGAYELDQDQFAPILNALISQSLRERAALSKSLKREVIDPLSVVLLGLERAIQLAQEGSVKGAGIQEAKSQLTEIRRTFRALTAFDFRLYPNLLWELGLDAAIRSLVRQFSEHAPSVVVDCDINILWDTSCERRDLAVFFVCKEALDNIRLHARAKNIRVALRSVDERHIRLQISDDGVGMPELFHVRGLVGVGLSAMRAVVGETGGTFDLFSREDTGTALSFFWAGEPTRPSSSATSA